MTPEVSSLADELVKISGATEADPVLEAIGQARELALLAKEQGEFMQGVVAGLSDFAGVAQKIEEMTNQLVVTDCQLSAVALSYKAGSESQIKSFTDALDVYANKLSQLVKGVENSQNELLQSNKITLSSALTNSIEETKRIVTNLIEEIEDGVKVEIANQQKLPVASFARGAVKRVDQAIPVIVVDETGKPVVKSPGGGGGYGGQITEVATKKYWNVSDVDETDANSHYYGYLNDSGAWYIMKSYQNQTYRYISGTSGYAAAWTGRVGLTYDYYNNVF